MRIDFMPTRIAASIDIGLNREALAGGRTVREALGKAYMLATTQQPEDSIRRDTYAEAGIYLLLENKQVANNA